MSAAKYICRKLVNPFGFSNGCAGVGVVEPAAVGAELLDRLLRRDRTARHDGRTRGLPARVLGLTSAESTGLYGVLPWKLSITPWLKKTTASTSDSGSRMRTQLRTRSTQKLPIVLERRRARAADQRDGDGEADRRRQEVLHPEHRHLREVRDGRLGHVALPVGVGDEAHGVVERHERLHAVTCVGLTGRCDCTRCTK